MRFRTPSDTAEMVWHGRVQIGDEPGVYGDASYSGLTAEFPVTLARFDDTDGPVNVAFELTAEGANNFGPPYQGHKVTIFSLDKAASSEPLVWEKSIVGEGSLKDGRTRIPVQLDDGVRYVSVRIEADPLVPPGSYDDFVLTELSLVSNSHYAEFGFRA